MKTVSAWQDFVKEPEKKDNILIVAEKSKRDLLSYLQSAPVYAAAAGMVFDEIAGTQTDIPLLAYEKDGFLWDSRDIYYLDKYNMKLNDEFMAHVLG